ncbi:MAG: hypothetical protein E4H07_09565, partial [Nitrosomonadales bacterium]
MELNNVFKLVTKSGHKSLDVVTSAIQKYARRGMYEEMLQAVSEMDAFMQFEESEDATTQRSAKAIRTNMINRLKVVLFEEVSFSQVGAFITVIKKIKEWEDAGRVDNTTLAKIVSIIAHAKKLRLPSYLQASYGNGDECTDKSVFLNGIDNQIISCMEWIYHNDEEALKMLADRQFSGKEHILPMVTTEWKRLKPTKSKAGSDERFSFVIVPWLWIMYSDDLNNDVDLVYPAIEKKAIKATYKKTDVAFEVFVYDEHTKEGRKGDKSVDELRKAGSVVSNEDTVWLSRFDDLKAEYDKQPITVVKKRRVGTKEIKIKDVKPKRLRRGAVKMDDIVNIEIDTNAVEFLENSTCARVLFKGKDKVIKPVGRNQNYGFDFLYIDKQKRRFGLNDLSVKLRTIHGKQFTRERLEKNDEVSGKTHKYYKYGWKDSDAGDKQSLVVMNQVDGTRLGNDKSFMKNEDNYK